MAEKDLTPPQLNEDVEAHNLVRSVTEERNIRRLLERYEDRLGEFEISTVGNAGFVLESKKWEPKAAKDWFFFDYDDTLGGTSLTKDKRRSLYREYARTQGIEAEDAQLDTLINTIDRDFSRWKDTATGEDNYHVPAHMSTLDWATKELQKGTKLGEFSADSEDNADTILGTLYRIRQELTINELPQEARAQVLEQYERARTKDPFHFNPDTKKFILNPQVRGSYKPWSDGIEDVFMKTNINPPHYQETIDALASLSHPGDDAANVNVGIFTRGLPSFQILKVLELLDKNPGIAIGQIWLTEVPKGNFIEELLKTKTVDSLKSTSGHPLDNQERAIIMLDDNPKDLSSILSKNELLQERTGASFVCVRSIREGTRESDKVWEVETPTGVIDFRGGEMDSNEVEKTLQINRFFHYRNRFGEADVRTQQIAAHLVAQGVDIDQLDAA